MKSFTLLLLIHIAYVVNASTISTTNVTELTTFNETDLLENDTTIEDVKSVILATLTRLEKKNDPPNPWVKKIYLLLLMTNITIMLGFVLTKCYGVYTNMKRRKNAEQLTDRSRTPLN